MKRNRAVLVTSVSTAMLGAGWAAGMVGTAFAAQEPVLTTTIDAAGASTPSADTTTGTPASPTSDMTTAPPASPSASAPATSAPPKTTAPKPALPSGTFDGASVKTRYGSYQVRLMVDAGKITDITMLKSGATDGTSREISGYALPRLINAVLKSQKANVGYVSGASYTSQGFEASVDDAMKRAGLS